MLVLTTKETMDITFAIMTRISWIGDHIFTKDYPPNTTLAYANEILRLSLILKGLGYDLPSTRDVDGNVSKIIDAAEKLIMIFSLTPGAPDVMIEKSDHVPPLPQDDQNGS